MNEPRNVPHEMPSFLWAPKYRRWVLKEKLHEVQRRDALRDFGSDKLGGSGSGDR